MKTIFLLFYVTQHIIQWGGSSNKPYKLTLYNLKSSYNIGDHIEFSPKLSKSTTAQVTVAVSMTCSGISTITRTSYIRAKKSSGSSISISASDYHSDEHVITSCTFSARSSDSSIPSVNMVVTFKQLLRSITLYSPSSSKLSSFALGTSTTVVLKIKPSSFPTAGELPISVSPSDCIRVSEHKKLTPISSISFVKGSPSTTFDIAANLENCKESTSYTLSITTPSTYSKWLKSPPMEHITIRTAAVPNVDITLSISGESSSIVPIAEGLSAKIKLSRKLTKFFDKGFPSDYKITLKEETNLIHFTPDSIPISLGSSGESKDSYSFKMSVVAPASTPLNIKLEGSSEYEKIKFKPSYNYRSGSQKQIKTSCDSKEHVKVGTKFKVSCRVYECPKGLNKDGQLIIRANISGGASGSGQFEWVEKSSGVINAFKSCGLTNKSKSIELEATTVGSANISFELDGMSKESYIQPASITVNITNQDPLYLEVVDKSKVPKIFNYDSKPYKIKVKLNDKLKTGSLAMKAKLETIKGTLEGAEIDDGSMVFDGSDKEKSFVLKFDKSCLEAKTCVNREFVVKFTNEGGLSDGQIVVMPDDLHFQISVDQKEESRSETTKTEEDKNKKEESKDLFSQIKQFLTDFFASDRNKIIALVVVILIIVYFNGRGKQTQQMQPQSMNQFAYGYDEGYYY
eukprot:GAHX01000641.1.p1 GENE.GAHX01000641.1~~GAHX01000641.1.p1  ORF type:complete len:698 (+),score=154.87 GAHX01000641.1:40-2094(+)